MEISGNIITPARRRTVAFIIFVCTLIFVICSVALGQQKASARSANPPSVKAIPDEVMLKIVRAEDERRWDNDLGALLFDKDGRVRERAALATGRIGDERAVASLITLLQTDKEASVRARAAFALAVTESATGATALSDVVQKANQSSEVRARAIEALGKIVAALPKSEA